MPTAAPTATLTLTTIGNEAAYTDLDTYWRTQLAGAVATLAAPVGSGDTTISVTVPGSVTLPATPFTVIIDFEPMIVTAASSSPWSVTRGSTVSPLATATTHLNGASVTALQFASVNQLLGNVIALKLASISSGLAAYGKSVVFAVMVSGTVTLS
jgi:hypothetical protein